MKNAESVTEYHLSAIAIDGIHITSCAPHDSTRAIRGDIYKFVAIKDRVRSNIFVRIECGEESHLKCPAYYLSEGIPYCGATKLKGRHVYVYSSLPIRCGLHPAESSHVQKALELYQERIDMAFQQQRRPSISGNL